MADEDLESVFSRMVRDPYFFKPLIDTKRKIIQAAGTWPQNTIPGATLFTQFTRDHDIIRDLVALNFLEAIHETEMPEYEPVLFVGDFQISYRVTNQTREFVKLELNNPSDLNRAILILLRAESASERLSGFDRVSTPRIGFYGLVMLLNKSEYSVLTSLKLLESMGLVELQLQFTEEGRVFGLTSQVAITSKGIVFLEKGTADMTFNNINIVNSNVGIVSLQSTLTNIDASVGNIKQKGDTQIADVLTSLTEQVSASALTEEEKRDLLEQVELIAEQAEKESKDRKGSIVKGALAFLEKALTAASGLAKIWTTCGPAIRTFFGI